MINFCHTWDKFKTTIKEFVPLFCLSWIFSIKGFIEFEILGDFVMNDKNFNWVIVAVCFWTDLK